MPISRANRPIDSPSMPSTVASLADVDKICCRRRSPSARGRGARVVVSLISAFQIWMVDKPARTVPSVQRDALHTTVMVDGPYPTALWQLGIDDKVGGGQSRRADLQQDRAP